VPADRADALDDGICFGGASFDAAGVRQAQGRGPGVQASGLGAAVGGVPGPPGAVRREGQVLIEPVVQAGRRLDAHIAVVAPVAGVRRHAEGVHPRCASEGVDHPGQHRRFAARELKDGVLPAVAEGGTIHAPLVAGDGVDGLCIRVQALESAGKLHDPSQGDDGARVGHGDGRGPGDGVAPRADQGGDQLEIHAQVGLDGVRSRIAMADGMDFSREGAVDLPVAEVP